MQVEMTSKVPVNLPFSGCPRRPINPIIWPVVLYLSYIWVKKEFVLYYF